MTLPVGEILTAQLILLMPDNEILTPQNAFDTLPPAPFAYRLSNAENTPHIRTRNKIIFCVAPLQKEIYIYEAE